MSLDFDNNFLRTYLQCVEDTEPPRIYHVWSALSGIAAAIGRNAYLENGIGCIFPNMFLAFVGPPAASKSTAMRVTKMFLERSTLVRFAPDDTGGQRQGLIKAIRNEKEKEVEKTERDVDNPSNMTMEELGNTQIDARTDVNKHCVLVHASELNSVLGQNIMDMLPFLNKMYDGEPYRYTLKNDEMILDKPLLNLIGGTTTTSIATAFPPEAVGQGFMSRIIFVYANKKYKSVPNPPMFDPDLMDQIEDTYEWAGKLQGRFDETAAGSAYFETLYDTPCDITDSRFAYYAQRRNLHLRKLAMCITASRKRRTIDVIDYQQANALLRATEMYMPDALGEYGMSKLSSAKQRLVEFLQVANAPVESSILYAAMQRDMNPTDYRASIADLTNANKIMQVTKPGAKESAYIYVENKRKDHIDQALLDLMTMQEPENYKENIIPFSAKKEA